MSPGRKIGGMHLNWQKLFFLAKPRLRGVRIIPAGRRGFTRTGGWDDRIRVFPRTAIQAGLAAGTVRGIDVTKE